MPDCKKHEQVWKKKSLSETSKIHLYATATAAKVLQRLHNKAHGFPFLGVNTFTKFIEKKVQYVFPLY